MVGPGGKIAGNIRIMKKNVVYSSGHLHKFMPKVMLTVKCSYSRNTKLKLLVEV